VTEVKAIRGIFGHRTVEMSEGRQDTQQYRCDETWGNVELADAKHERERRECILDSQKEKLNRGFKLLITKF
jgi:uncharacterized Zn ribbon protein